MFQWFISFLRKLAVFKGFKAPVPVGGQSVAGTGEVPAERAGSGQNKEIGLMEQKVENALATVSLKLGVPPSWLRNLIQFESAWKPDARNPYTGARGLIQFMPSTARALGFDSADDLVAKYPDTVSQLLTPVLQYFQQPGNRPPYPTEQSLYMTVFYPAARSWSLDTVFPDTVRKVNPGIVKVGDYVNKVNRTKIIKTGIGAGVIIALAGIAFLIYKHFQKGGTI
jgi:Transglycosylase SLT domain